MTQVSRVGCTFMKNTSIQNSPVSGSFATVAVSPAADEDFPEVYTDRGTKLVTYLNINPCKNFKTCFKALAIEK